MRTESMTHFLSYFMRCVSVLSPFDKTRPLLKMHILKIDIFWLYETGRVTARGNTCACMYCVVYIGMYRTLRGCVWKTEIVAVNNFLTIPWSLMRILVFFA